MDSETTSESTPGHQSAYFSESDEEEPAADGLDGFGYGNGGFRATFFRVSSERGQWKDDPMALKPTTSAGTRRIQPSRQSLPTISRPSSVVPSVTARPISVPLDASKPQEAYLDGPSGHDQDDVTNQEQAKGSSASIPILLVESAPSRQPSHPPSVREPTPDNNHHNDPMFSPLPPSSPPLSPMSGCLPSLSRSVSPLSFAASSPTHSPCNALALQLDNQDKSLPDAPAASSSESTESESMEVNVVDDDVPSASHLEVEIEIDVEETVASPPTLTCKATPLALLLETPESHPVIDVTQARSPSTPKLIVSDVSSLTDVMLPNDESSQIKADVTTGYSAPTVTCPSNPISKQRSRSVSPNENASASTSATNAPAASASPVMELAPLVTDKKEKDERALRIQDDNGQSMSTSSTTKSALNGKAKSLKRKQAAMEPETSARGAMKKQRMDEVKSVRRGKKAKKMVVVDDSDSDESDDEMPQVKPTASTSSKPTSRSQVDTSKRKSECEPQPKPRKKPAATRQAKASTSSSRSTSKKFLPDSPVKAVPTSSSKPTDPINETVRALFEELKGMLIETMATSRASSLAVSVLTKSILQTHPGLRERMVSLKDVLGADSVKRSARDKKKAEEAGSENTAQKLNERDWRRVVGRVLYAGMAPSGSGVFGRVESSGKDDSDRPLESQWFYVPENDEDQDRATLIRSMMPRPAKRSETKKYKQYYWRPLDKISRWDTEDDL